MAEVKRRNAEGIDELYSKDPDKSKEDIETNAAIARASTTAGADLEGVAARARAAQKVEETDETKMSPLARLAYQNKKRRKVTADDAANALSTR